MLDGMARATPELIAALRNTIDRLSGDTIYAWGHMGMCNCGHLAQSAPARRAPSRPDTKSGRARE
jgi:hypothetical protein